MVRFSNQLVAEAIQPMWAALQAGAFLTDAAPVAGTHRRRARVWVHEAGGVRPRRGRDLKGRCLSFAEREEIALARARGESIRVIARRLGRARSTVSRELRRNADLPRWWLPGDDRSRAGLRARRSPEAGQARDEPRAPRARAGRSDVPLLARADRRAPAPPVPRRPGDVGVDRDDLPVALRAVARGTQARTDHVPAHRAVAAQARPHRRPAQEPHPRHGQHRRSPARGLRPRGARPLGGRPADRQAQRHRDRHPRRTRQRLRDAHLTTRWLQARARRARPHQEDPRRCPTRCAAR